MLAVSADELAVVQRFGRQAALLGPGLHVRPWGICEKVTRLQPRVARFVAVGSADASNPDDRDLPIADLMLTGDVWPRIEPATQSASLPEAPAVRSLSQLVQVQAAVQYGIADPSEFLFTVHEPDRIVQTAAEAVLRSIIAGRSMSVCLGEQRGLIAEQARLLLQERLDGLGCGIEVDAFILTDIRPFGIGRDPQETGVQFQEMETGLQTQSEGDRLLADAHRQAMAVVAAAESDRGRRVQAARDLLEQVQTHADVYRLDPSATRVRLLIEQIGRMTEGRSMLRRMLSETRADDVPQTQEGSSP
jgi:regulator of protease activity HflC (stomatin/prohibitin superfamily)